MKMVIFFGGVFTTQLQAAVVKITASFSPSISNPSNNKFINTTPQSGYCVFIHLIVWILIILILTWVGL